MSVHLRANPTLTAEGVSDRLVEEMTADRVAAGVPEHMAATSVLRFRERLAQGSWSSYDVVRGAEVTGELAVCDFPDWGPLLVHLHAPQEDLSPALTALVELLREAGSRKLSIAAIPGPYDLTEAARELGAVHEATRMQLDLSREVPSGSVHLEPMTEEEYAAFEERSIREYAAEKFSTGGYADQEAALVQSRKEFAELLPDGIRSPLQHLFTVRSDDRAVGMLWLLLDGDWSFIYDIRMEDDLRGQGHGTGTLREGARWARDHGATHLGLNVFGANTGARRLYEREGYDTTERFFRIDL